MRYLVFVIAITVLSFTAHAADLAVAVNRVSTENGQIIVQLYSTRESYARKSGDAFATRSVPANSSSVEIVFRDVAAGRYAVVVMHDRNSNGELDFNSMGIPQEPYGFSRNARGMFGPPKFKKTAIDVGLSDLSIAVDLTNN